MRNWSLRGAALVAVAVVVAGSLAASLGVRQAGAAGAAVRFTITIDGFEIGTFNELVGIVQEVKPAPYFSTDDKDVVLGKLPGTLEMPTVVLRRPFSQSLDFAAWHEAVRLGQLATARRSASLTMFDADGVPVARYFLEKAWPSKLELGSSVDGKVTAYVETVTLVSEYIVRIAP